MRLREKSQRLVLKGRDGAKIQKQLIPLLSCFTTGICSLHKFWVCQVEAIRRLGSEAGRAMGGAMANSPVYSSSILEAMG